MLTFEDSEYIELVSLINQNNLNYQIGLDSCQSPALIRNIGVLSRDSIECCDAARFSMYIDCELHAYPCSFGHNQERYSYNLNVGEIKDAWVSEKFELFRNNQNLKCVNCRYKECRGCGLDIGINVCGQF